MQVGTLEASKLSMVTDDCSFRYLTSLFACAPTEPVPRDSGASALTPGGGPSRAHLFEKGQERALGDGIRRGMSVAILSTCSDHIWLSWKIHDS